MTKNTRAILLMITSVGMLTCLDGIVKLVNGLGMHPFQIAFLRNFFGVLALLPFFIKVGFQELHTSRLTTHIARGVVHAISMIAWFWALTLVPLADATALSFMVPVFASIGAIVIMKEPSKFIRWASIFIGFIGMLIILRPGFVEISMGTWLVLGGAIFVAISKLLTKTLSRTESPTTIVAYMSFIVTIVSLLPAIFVWKWPTVEMFFWLLGMGALGSVAHVIQAQSYKEGDVTLIEPVGFVRLIWAALIGFIVFGEQPLISSWLGGGVIMLSVIILIKTNKAVNNNHSIKIHPSM
jgi:drug/metabolite transporter (DMT)-like permease